MPLKKRLLAVMAGLLTLTVVAPAAAEHGNGDHPFGDPRFEERWGRTDRPVSQAEIDRTWVWGPTPHTDAFVEPYADSPGGERMVQYFDKSRMEINDPDAEGLWSVTNGLLVVEMVEGAIQTGDDEFDTTPEPADVQIAGDGAGAIGPTYADIASFGLRDVDSNAEGSVLDEYLAMTSIEESDEYAAYGVEAAYHVSETNHTVAGPFWDFMNSTGLIYKQASLMSEKLFQDPFYATGYPITEAYWTTTPVGGESRDVLWQCFERRCMTYTPNNPDGWKVETGNVGQHYFEWRYEDQDEVDTENASIYLVDLEGSEDGIPLETGESLIPVEVEINRHDTTEDRIATAVNALIGYEHDRLDNAYADADASVESVAINNSLATVNLEGNAPIGGVGDHPRIGEQLRHTVMQFDGVDDSVGLLNGGPLIEPLGTPSDGVVAIWDVDGEQFRMWTSNQQTIADLEAIQAGGLDGHFPTGSVVDGSGEAGFNGPWGWHIDPTDASITDNAETECDVTPSELESSQERFMNAVGRYCPSDAELIDLLDYRNN